MLSAFGVNSKKGEKYHIQQDKPYGCLYHSLAALLQDTSIIEENNTEDLSQRLALYYLIEEKDIFPDVLWSTWRANNQLTPDSLWNSERSRTEQVVEPGVVCGNVYWCGIDVEMNVEIHHAIGIKHIYQITTDEEEIEKVFIYDTRYEEPIEESFEGFLNGFYSDLDFVAELLPLERKFFANNCMADDKLDT